MVHNYNSIPVELMTDQIQGNIVPGTTIVETAGGTNENIESHINPIRVDSDKKRIVAIQRMLSLERCLNWTKCHGIILKKPLQQKRSPLQPRGSNGMSLQIMHVRNSR